ncbi:MAG TPA: mechanosensitive ion channel domain-containing protein [Burkholderiaceae bacterium]|nr:mechanosensitive ion channel domain-containing protein [Burkholderiaceae bacterium]
MIQPATDLQALLHSFARPTALIELAVAAVCVGLAWGLVRLLRGAEADETSVWFGRRIFDGVLFPLLALALVFGARLALEGVVEPAVFRVVIPVLMSLAVIRLSVRVLSAAFPASRVMRAAERTISWGAWLAVVLWITGVLPVLMQELDQIRWSFGKGEVSLRKLIEGALSAGLVLMLALWVSAAIEAKLLKGAVGERLSLRKAAANLLRAVLLFVGLLIALSAVGIDLTALSVLGGALGVGIGFGLQKLAANYVSGFVILAERSLRIGDYVRVDNFEGWVTDITTRYTVIRSAGGRESIVPNETLITTRVENLSLADRNLLLTTVVQVAYGTDVASLRAKVVDAVSGIERVVKDPGPSCHLTGFASDGLELTVFFWIADPENGQANVRSAVNLAILDLFQREGIEIPYPQRVLRIVGEESRAVEPDRTRAAA